MIEVLQQHLDKIMGYKFVGKDNSYEYCKVAGIKVKAIRKKDGSIVYRCGSGGEGKTLADAIKRISK